MDNSFEFTDKIITQIKENEEEFIYKIIAPYCETIVEKRLSKKELENILRKGMQASIPLDKVKQAREEIENMYEDFDGYDPQSLGDYASRVYETLDKLIESEVKHD